VRRDGKTGSSCPCGVLTNEEVDRYALLTEGRRSNRTLISFIMRLRFSMTPESGSPSTVQVVDMDACTDPSAAQGRTRSSCCYARGNVGCSIR
jgi:hypothetical protein